ncbi:hypothetical protein EIP86_011391 [Pleurotus ostreatoroseus]|nr:hypothetical protein EIP86_011391 [Pleurotus ostreatoroseus]
MAWQFIAAMKLAMYQGAVWSSDILVLISTKTLAKFLTPSMSARNNRVRYLVFYASGCALLRTTCTHLILAQYISAVSKRLACVIPIPAGQTEHEGKHSHNQDANAFHFCEATYQHIQCLPSTCNLNLKQVIPSKNMKLVTGLCRGLNGLSKVPMEPYLK